MVQKIADNMRHLLMGVPNLLCQRGVKACGPVLCDAIHKADQMAAGIRQAGTGLAKQMYLTIQKFTNGNHHSATPTSSMMHYVNATKDSLVKVGNGTIHLGAGVGRKVCFWRKKN